MAKIKHIHVAAEGYGEDKTNLTSVILTYEEDGSGVSEETKTFSLPDEENRIQQYVDSVFSSNEPPSNITKQNFRQQIVDYSINIATKSPNYDEVNKYYDVVLNTPETQNAVPTENFLKAVEEYLDQIQKEKEENLSIYQQSLAPEDSINYSSGDDEYDPDSLQDEEWEDVELDYPTSNRKYASSGFEDPEKAFADEQKKLFGDKPTEGGNRPVVDMAGMSVEKTKVFASLPASSTSEFKGIAGAKLIEPVPEPIYYPGDSYLKGENNSGIICSRDEIYRLRGHSKSGAVYIYAGRVGDEKNQSSPEDFSNPELESPSQPNNLISDSAYIYISQKADVDSLYKYKVAKGTYSKTVAGLTKEGEVETRQGISLAAIKADDVVIMSRVSGIRLITGTDVKNSKGGDQNSKFGIDLIGGNDDSDLQPLVKGTNLLKYLTFLSDSIDDIRKVLYDFMNSQSKLNAIVAKHTHYDQFGIFLGTAGPKNPLAINGGKGLPSDELMSAGTTSLMETLRQQANTVNAILNKIGNDTNALTKIGSYKILSEKNRTN